MEVETPRKMAREAGELVALQLDEPVEGASGQAMDDQSEAASSVGDQMPVHSQDYV